MKQELLDLFQSNFFALLLGLLSGIIAWSFINLNIAYYFLISTVAVGIFLFGAKIKDKKIIFVSLFILGLSIGAIRFENYDAKIPRGIFDDYVNSFVSIKGEIASEVDSRESGTRLRVRVREINDKKVSEKLYVLVRADLYQSQMLGDLVLVKGILDKPENFVTDTGRTFDYISYLEKDGILYILNKAQIEEISSSKKMSRYVFIVKNFFKGGLIKALPEPTASLAGGILLGAKNSLGSYYEEVFRHSGIIHIVVLSGYNVTIVAEFILKILVFVQPLLRIITGAFGIIIFAFAVGAGAPVVRSSIMALIVLLSRASYRKYNISRALLFSACVMVFITPPLLLSDLSFQLSFLATIGVIYVSPIVVKKLKFLPEKFGIRDIVSVTLSAQLVVLPLLLYSIGELSIVSPLVNTLVLPIIPLAMLLSFIAGMVGIFSSTLSILVGYPAFIVLSYVFLVAEKSVQLPFSVIPLPSFSPVLILITYIVFGIIYFRASE